MKMNMVVAYDIANPRRLNKVAKILGDYGTRVQKSIFEVCVDGTLFSQMRLRIEKVIVPRKDGVKYFPACEKCAGTVEIIGLGVFTDPDQEFYVL